MAQRQPLHEGLHIARFCHGRLQKLPPGRRIVKKIAHHKCGSLRAADLFEGYLLAAFHHIADAGDPLVGLGYNLHLCHGGDTGKSLAPESQRADGLQIFRRRNLAGGMPEERLLNLFFLNAAAVVGDADKINAAALDLDGHRRGTGVHRVFHQLLHDRSRPLHYFARGDLINRILIQYIYYSHGFLLSAGDSPPVHFLYSSSVVCAATCISAAAHTAH